LDRIKFAAVRIFGKSVVIFDREGWHRMILPNGELTRVGEVPEPFTGITQTASIVAITACGFGNPNPQIELVRFDAKDRPYVYNIDRYTVIQTLNLHPRYQEILSAAGVQENAELSNFLRNNILVIGPDRPDYHWVRELPEHIKNAKIK